MRIVIVASGPSAAGFIPPIGATVIAVNGAIDWLSRADHFFTLDPSLVNVRRLNSPRPGVKYHIALPAESVNPAPAAKRWLRVSSQENEPAQKGSAEWWLWRWGAVKTLNRYPGRINTGNSAWGALGLAYHLGAEKVILVGVDADRSPRIDGGVPNVLSHLPLLFDSAVGELPIVNCGAMQCALPSMTIEEGMTWLMQ